MSLARSIHEICCGTPLLRDLVVIVADYAGPPANELLRMFTKDTYHMPFDELSAKWVPGIHSVSLHITPVPGRRESYHLVWCYEGGGIPYNEASIICALPADLLTPPYKRVRESMPKKWSAGDRDKYMRLYAIELAADMEAGRPAADGACGP